MLIIKNLKVSAGKKIILDGINLAVKKGEIHVLMGPNGAGKTTLALSLLGQSNFKFQIDGEDLIKLKTEERARKGLFVSFQNPLEIEGVSFFSFLRSASKALCPDQKISISIFKENVKKALGKVGLKEDFLYRFLNKDFSGGEKKRAEIAQLLLFKPKFAILDEIDSGLDIDSLKTVIKVIKEEVEKNKLGLIFITHYPKIADLLKPNFVHALINGKIRQTGGLELAKKIEEKGYDAI